MSRTAVVIGAALAVAALAPGVHAVPTASSGWPECRTLKPGASFETVSARLGGHARRLGFAVVDNLPVATYAFRRSAQTCRVQIEEGMLLANPVLR